VALELANLDEQTRKYMIEEVHLDISEGRLYLSEWFTDQGRRVYPDLLKRAIADGSDLSLEEALRAVGIFQSTYVKRKPSGGTTVAKVPFTAPQTFGEGEFNRFYIRGLCRLCLDKGIQEIEIHRAKQVANPRAESEARIGKRIPCQKLLDDLHRNIGVDTALGVPAGPNSGLSVRIPR